MKTSAILGFTLCTAQAAWAAPPAPAVPNSTDLAVTSLNFSPENPKVGDTVRFTATVENAGATRAKGWKATLKLGTKIFDELTVSETRAALADKRRGRAPTTITFQKSWQPTVAARLKAEVVVEPLGTEVDRTLENNTKTTMIAVVAPTLPDLTITQLQIRPVNPQDPAQLRVGDKFELHAIVKNLTPVEVNGPIDFLVARTTHHGSSDTTHTYPEVPVALKGLESKTILLSTSTAAPGPLDFLATVDYSKKLAEANETNNSSPLLVTNPLPSLLADLSCRIVLKAIRGGVLREVAHKDVVFGEAVRVFTEFENRGPGPALVASRAKLEMTNAASVVFDVPPLNKGQKTELEPVGPWMASYGTTLFHLLSDVHNDVKETLEGDQAWASVTLRDPNGPHPDLEITSVRAVNVSTGTAGPFRAGDRFAVIASITNDSPYPATTLGSFRIAVQTKMNSGVIIDYYYKNGVGSLAASESRELELYSGLLVSAGTPSITLVVSADHEDKVIERDEQNNSRTESFTVSP